jgi:hypothetical protein
MRLTDVSVRAMGARAEGVRHECQMVPDVSQGVRHECQSRWCQRHKSGVRRECQRRESGVSDMGEVGARAVSQ